MKKKLCIGVCHHFDLMWRRPFLKRFLYNGNQILSYSDVEGIYILGQMDLAEKHPDYKFQIESVAVAKTFLARNPEQRDRLKGLMEQGRVSVGGTGYCIVDGNMVSGETFVRNYLLEQRWRKEEQLPRNVMAIRTDAFGNSAQLPQILRGFGYEWLNSVSYVTTDKEYWRGLDGTMICMSALPAAGDLASAVKYGPCPTCKGFGTVNGETCPECHGSCVDLKQAAKFGPQLNLVDKIEAPVSFLSAAGEETFPTEHLVEMVDQLREQYDVEYVLPRDIYPMFREKVEDYDPEQIDPKDIFEGELNPACTGCYVSQIETKQKPRYFEHQLLGNEVLAAMTGLRGGTVLDDRELWENVLFMFFHDAVTGTHVNAAHEELVEFWDRTEKGLQEQRTAYLAALRTGDRGMTIVNPSGSVRTEILSVPVRGPVSGCKVLSGSAEVRVVELLELEARVQVRNLAPYAAVTFEFISGAAEEKPVCEASEEMIIRNEHYEIKADRHGLLEIRDLKADCVISTAGEYRPLEFVVAGDAGSPWATLRADQSNRRLSPWTTVTACEKTDAYERLCLTAGEPGFGLSGCFENTNLTCEITLYAGSDRIDLSADVDWNDYEDRLKLMLPLTMAGRHLYEIPFGVLERKPYTPTYHWSGANGDYPVNKWAGVEGECCSVAMLNRGTPSYRITDLEGGSLLELSLLRSPCMPAYLQEEQFYTMKDWGCIRDRGMHHFDCAVTSYGCTFADSTVAEDANSFNAALICTEGTLDLPELPCVIGGCAHITSLKRAEDEDGLILRLVETGGRACKAELHIPAAFSSCTRCRLDETAEEALSISAERLGVELKPFQIVTLRIR